MVMQVPEPYMYLTGRRALRYIMSYVATRGHWDNGMGKFAVEYREQALIRIWLLGAGPHIILNWRRVGVPIILNGPFFFFF